MAKSETSDLLKHTSFCEVIYLRTDAIYRLHDCRLASITSNGGRSWSNSMFSVDSVKGNREGYPINWK